MNLTRVIPVQPLSPHTTSQAAITSCALSDDDRLEQAFNWLCKRRKDWPPSADVWRFRRDWVSEKAQIQQDLLTGTYEIGLLDRVTLMKDGQPEEVDLWSARDAVVMKALAGLLQEHLPLSARCMHLKGHGGLKQAVSEVEAALTQHRFVLKTDVQSYYASVDHGRLLDLLATSIADRRVLALLVQYLRRSAERGGLIFEHRRGISLGCPLSPIIGAFFLSELDARLDQTGLFWRRYMDDVLVLAPTRWKLRQAVKVVNQVFTSLGLVKHPDKTFIGRIEKRFEWLGYELGPEGLSVARPTRERFVARCRRLYERSREMHDGASRLGDYVLRWVRWYLGGIPMDVQWHPRVPWLRTYRQRRTPKSTANMRRRA